jgi:chemotaxis signal transduction protein
MTQRLLPAVQALTRQFASNALPGTEKRNIEQRWRALEVGNLRLLVAHDCGGELLEQPNVFPLPRTVSWCRGLINLRGHLIPAFDLHACLGLTPPNASLRGPRQWWLVLGQGKNALAFLVDALPRSLSIAASSSVTMAVMPERLRAHLGAAYRVDGELWLEFRYQDFFTALTPAMAA